MKLHTFKNGYTLHRATSGGKAGFGLNKTNSFQVRDGNNCILKQFRFKTADPVGASRAEAKAIEFCRSWNPADHNPGTKALIND